MKVRANEIYGKIFDKYSHNFHTSYSWSLQDDEILDPIIQKYAEMALIEAKKQFNIDSISDMFTNANLAVSFINKMRFIFNNYIIDDKTFTSRLNTLLNEIGQILQQIEKIVGVDWNISFGISTFLS